MTVNIPILRVNDRIRMKKSHPCGGDTFLILRVGSRMRVRCEKCGRDMDMDRIKLEKTIRELPSHSIENETRKDATT